MISYRIRPSALARTVQCPASLTLSERYPDTEGESAREGTAAHWVVQRTIEGAPPAEGTLAPNGVAVTDEMLDAADLVCETIEADLAPFGKGLSDVAVELPVHCPDIHDECGGTPDYRAWIAGPRPKLYVWDFKYGRRLVEPVGNFQLMAYATGAIAATKHHDLEVDLVLQVIQPRAFHRHGPVRWWATTGAGLRGHINRAVAACEEALGASPAARTGPECEHCSARHACPALSAAGYSAMEVAQTGQPLGLKPDELGLELRLLRSARDRLDARITGLEEQAAAILSAGDRVPGWTIEHGAGRPQWAVDPATVLALGQAQGVSLAKPVDVVTPNQAVKAGMPKPLVDAFTKRTPGAAKLAPVNDADAIRVFGR